MLRSASQNRAFHALMGDFARQFSHEGVHLTAAEWKLAFCCYFEAALAEADGREAKPIPLPESTSKMDVDRMNNLLEYVLFISAQLGLNIGIDVAL
jgi:hypothetical protein